MKRVSLKVSTARISKTCSIGGILLLLSMSTFAQTPGLIFKTAGSGAVVLDPNNDGYTSLSTAGFTTNDKTQSEISYRPLAVPAVEPEADPGSGPSCGVTDIVDSGDEDPVFSYFDAGNNLLFRFRVGDAAPNAKGYSVLIDADQKFGFSGSNADPNAVTGNPGFEIEIVLRTNFGVSLYDVDGTTSPVLKTTFAYDNYAQKSVALTANCGDADYFYDFYIPFSAVTSFFPSVTASTPLRLVAVTSMNPAPAIGNSTVSDAGGIDDQAYGYNYDNIFGAIVDNFYPTPVTGINSGFAPDRSACPAVTGSITTLSTGISGTSSEGNGTVIKVFQNGALLGTTTVSSNTWTLTGIPALASGDIITATATASGESESYNNCSSIAVATATICSAPPPNAPVDDKGICGTGAVAGALIRVYLNGVVLIPSSGSIGVSGNAVTVQPDGTWQWKCNTNNSNCSSGSNCLTDGYYTFTQQVSGQCESEQALGTCFNGNSTGGSPSATTAPVIATSPVLTTTTSLSGTSVSGATVYLFADGTQIGTTTASGTNWTVAGLTLVFGQVITAKAVSGTNCISNASTSETVTSVSAAPVISGAYCTAATVSSISGTTTEAGGTVIEVFSNSVSVGTTASGATGAWTLTGLSLPPGAVITATATATGEIASAVSGSITIGSKTSNSGLTVNGPVSEGQTSLTGTVTGTATVKIYIDGGLLGTASVSGSTWTLSGLSSADVYAGASVTATVTTAGNCESNATSGITVQCVAPSTTRSVTPASISLCEGETTSVTVGSSETGIIYQLYNGAAATGASKLGTGGDIVLISGALSTSATISVKVLKISPVSCTASLSTTQSVIVTPVISSNVLTGPATTAFCGPGNPDVITGSAPSGGSGIFTYQWQDSPDNSIFNDITGATARDYDPPVVSNTTYYRRVVTSNSCSSTSTSITIAIQVTGLTNTISVGGSTAFCVGGDPAPINGSLPTGGSGPGTYTYVWQSSTDNTSFSDVGGAVSQNYDPSSISQTTYFRRLVSSGTCTGFPSSSVKFSVATTAHTFISASSSSIIADGVSTSVITVQLKDASGNITSSGCLPVLSTTLGTLSSVADNGDGTYTATLTSATGVGTANITGIINGLAITDSETVGFMHGPASAATTTITAVSSSITANGTSTTVVIVHTKDVNGNTVSTGGAAIALSTTLGSLSGVTDNGDGTYTATLTSSPLNGAATITGSLNSVAITDNETVNFVNTDADPAISTITAAPASIIADGVSMTLITIQAKNNSGVNLVTGGLSIVLSNTSGTLSSVIDNGDGTYTATLTSSTVAGIATVTGTLDGNAMTDSEDVNFLPGPVSSTASTIVAASNSIVANGTSTTAITVQTKDSHGNNISGGGATVLLSASLGTLSSVLDHGDGTYTATLTSTATAGVATVTGTLNGQAFSDNEIINFVPGPASASTTAITAASNSIVANGTSTTTITVQLSDAGGNIITVGGAAITLSVTLGSLSSVTDQGDGTYTATLTSSSATGNATVAGTLNGIAITDTETVNFSGQIANAAASLITAAPASIIADGSSTSVITVQLKDSDGSNITTGGATVILSATKGTLSPVTDHGNGTYSATLISSASTGLSTISGSVDGVAITDNESVLFTAGAPSTAVSLVTAAVSSIAADGAGTVTVTVQLIDAFGNVITSGGASVELAVSSGSISAITDNGDGTYTATLTAPTVPGTATLTATLNGSALTDNEMVEFTPLAGTLTASVTEIIADGISSSTLTVMLRNSGNNPVAGATVTMASTAGKLSSVTDNSDGTYVAILTSSPTPEKAVISYAVFGITGSQTVEVVFSARGLFIPEGFSPDGDGKNDTFIIQGAENFMISLTVYNRWGNIVYESKDYKNDWDGLANHGIVIGDKLPDGTYYYVVDLNNGNKPFVRFMTIKRK